MINDAIVEVYCDGEHCKEMVQVALTALAMRNAYDMRNVERELTEGEGWILPNGMDGETYCSRHCAGLPEDDDE